MDFVNHYLIALHAEGKTPATLRWHRQSLSQFMAWLEANDHSADPVTWTPAVLRQYIVHNQTRVSRKTGKRLSPTAVNSLIRSLQAFTTWLYEEEVVPTKLFLKVQVPKAPSLAKPTLSHQEIHHLLETIRSSRRNALRDEAILTFLIDTGCRASELAALELDGINWDQMLARVWGKGSKERYVPFSPKTARALQRYWMKERKGNSVAFFQSEDGIPLTRYGLFQIFKRLSKKSEVAVSPHKLRHTHAIEYLRGGGSVFALQKQLGHTSLDMTLRYSRLLTDDLVEAHRQFSPIMRVLQKRSPGSG